MVEHHPIQEGETGAAANMDMDTQTQDFTIPLYEEEVEVTKNTVVSDEVTIRKERDTRTEHVKADVRKERLDVENPTENENIETKGTPKKDDLK